MITEINEIEYHLILDQEKAQPGRYLVTLQNGKFLALRVDYKCNKTKFPASFRHLALAWLKR